MIQDKGIVFLTDIKTDTHLIFKLIFKLKLNLYHQILFKLTCGKTKSVGMDRYLPIHSRSRYVNAFQIQMLNFSICY